MFTVTDIVVVVAHCPSVGVKVYVVVAVLLMLGDQVPEIGVELALDVGRLMDSPLQIAGIWLNAGVITGLTVTDMVVVVAHCPASGVKVYSVVAVLLMAGNQVPVNPSLAVVVNVNDSPLQIAGTCVKVGVTGGPTFTDMVAVVAHCPASGVKV